MINPHIEKHKEENLVGSSMSESAQNRVLKYYFQTTSAVGVAGKTPDYKQSTAGLKRALGSWLDISGKDVVDLGCGTGELCWLVNYLGARTVVGVNLSQEEINIASQRITAKFVNKDIVSFLTQQPNGSYDRIFAMNILEHVSKDELVQVLEESARCLRDDGQLVAMVPNATSPFGCMTRYWDITHQLAFTPSSVRQLMRLCGFSKAEFRELGPRPHGVISAIRYLLWQACRAMIWFRLMIETASVKGGIYTADMLFRLTKEDSK
ncbi:MAG: class I SAM-dependent methyltransferase [Sulfuricaulis sp.]|uniref:class I SAM-dependent methyltransferase n=1 Tax=Sulfuricaulis sp. TaxID=2003553 RepID=UPI0034A4B226